MNQKIKYFVIFLAIALLGAGGYYAFALKSGGAENYQNNSQCKIGYVKLYYLKQCSWCQKVKDDGTIDKLRALGVQVEEIDAAVGPVRDKISGTPAFVIDGKVYEGYRTFDEIKALLSCPLNETEEKKPQEQLSQAAGFYGEKETELALRDGNVQLDALPLTDGIAKFYNVKMPSGKTIYFFAVKDQFGTYRAAADACEVCYGERKGFRQEGNQIVCNNCGNSYPLEKIATEKGGCNPGPINPNLKVANGKISITQQELEQVEELF